MCRRLAVSLLVLWPLTAAAQPVAPEDAAAGGPAEPTPQAVLVDGAEPGEPLVVTGRIVAPDGVTPVAGARLYVYQTDRGGIYSERGSRHPRLRGWAMSGPDGRYEIRTIRPGSYPGSRVPAHIHATLQPPRGAWRWIDDFLFADDPFVSERQKSRAREAGRFSNVMEVARDASGGWRGERDLRLPQPAAQGSSS